MRLLRQRTTRGASWTDGASNQHFWPPQRFCDCCSCKVAVLYSLSSTPFSVRAKVACSARKRGEAAGAKAASVIADSRQCTAVHLQLNLKQNGSERCCGCCAAACSPPAPAAARSRSWRCAGWPCPCAGRRASSRSVLQRRRRRQRQQCTWWKQAGSELCPRRHGRSMSWWVRPQQCLRRKA